MKQELIECDKLIAELELKGKESRKWKDESEKVMKQIEEKIKANGEFVSKWDEKVMKVRNIFILFIYFFQLFAVFILISIDLFGC